MLDKSGAWLVAATLLGACAVPQPQVGPAELQEGAIEEDDSAGTPQFSVPGCDSLDCQEACEPVPAADQPGCAEAYDAGCFSTPPPEGVDCMGFGVDEKEEESETADDGASDESDESAPDVEESQAPPEQPPDKKLFEAPEHD